MDFIEAKNVTHRFVQRDEEGQVTGEIYALDGIDLSVHAGQFIAVLGRNGSGKSTFARHLNALLTPTGGTLFVDEKDANDPDAVWDIRRTAGMIFQNPDNQIVAGVVEEDVAFGPENLGLPTGEIKERVTESLETVEMTDYRHHTPHRLSGGQKQRVAVAGVVAMRPACILMDEATAMLDPGGREEVLETVRRLNREAGVTVILITHFMEEAAGADYVYVLEKGKVALHGTPRDLFSQPERLRACGLTLPPIGRLAEALRRDGIPIPAGILTRGELAEALDEILPSPGNASKESPLYGDGNADGPDAAKEATERAPAAAREKDEAERDSGMDPGKSESNARDELLRLEHVSYTYSPGTVYETRALSDVNMALYEGEIVGLIGPTGSGKSTLIQMLNGLLAPDEGTIRFKGKDIREGVSLRRLRGEVGLVFQSAESQLFDSSVLRDVAFGPKNMGLKEAQAQERARTALRLVGLSEAQEEMSPFDLSGGEQRRAAIAGVLAMGPSVLILDEPTAGLDPEGREELLGLLRRLRDEQDITILFISHNMEDIAELADRILVMEEGEIRMEGSPAGVFSHVRELTEASLAVPEVTYLMADLGARGTPVNPSVTTVEQAKEAIERLC